MEENLLSPVEQRVVAVDTQGVNLEISFAQARSLLASGQYQPSLGEPLDAGHYRRPLVDGSCLHLVVYDHKVLLHSDRFNPDRDFVSLTLHLLTEARDEALDLVSAAWLLLCRAAR
jgi:hypothetical protein